MSPLPVLGSGIEPGATVGVMGVTAEVMRPASSGDAIVKWLLAT